MKTVLIKVFGPESWPFCSVISIKIGSLLIIMGVKMEGKIKT